MMPSSGSGGIGGPMAAQGDEGAAWAGAEQRDGHGDGHEPTWGCGLAAHGDVHTVVSLTRVSSNLQYVPRQTLEPSLTLH